MKLRNGPIPKHCKTHFLFIAVTTPNMGWGKWHQNPSGGFAQDAGDFELYVFGGGFDDFNCGVEPVTEGADDFVDQHFGGRRPGGDADRFDPVQRAPVDIGGPLHQLGIDAARAGGDFDQTFGV